MWPAMLTQMLLKCMKRTSGYLPIKIFAIVKIYLILIFYVQDSRVSHSKFVSQRFHDLTRGTLFHEIMRIVRESKPKILFLENVLNLHAHDGGNTFAVIKASIEQEGYDFSSVILSPHEFGTPQIRKRLYMVAIKKEYCQSELISTRNQAKNKCQNYT